MHFVSDHRRSNDMASRKSNVLASCEWRFRHVPERFRGKSAVAYLHSSLFVHYCSLMFRVVTIKTMKPFTCAHSIIIKGFSRRSRVLLDRAATRWRLSWPPPLPPCRRQPLPLHDRNSLVSLRSGAKSWPSPQKCAKQPVRQDKNSRNSHGLRLHWVEVV